MGGCVCVCLSVCLSVSLSVCPDYKVEKCLMEWKDFDEIFRASPTPYK